MGALSKLKGLGPKSEVELNNIGIFTENDLRQLGAVEAYLKLEKLNYKKPSLNFLYALVGALEDKDWRLIAKSERTRLIFELDGREQLKELVCIRTSPKYQ